MKSYSQRRSRLQEKRAARDLGGKVQKGSGSSAFAKGDVRAIGHVRGECKFTKKSTYILKHDELLKIQMEALKGGFEDWVMQVEFVGFMAASKKFAIVDCKMFMEMWSEAKPAGYENQHLSWTTVYQVGKSLKLDSNKMTNTGMHLNQLAFVTEEEAALTTRTGAFPMPKNVYAIVPWQAYLDVRKSYMEREQ